MKLIATFLRSRLLALPVLLALLAGCATNKIDWPGRVGSYTYDQAVLEFGPPEKSAKLEDGTTVADWLLRRGSSSTYVSPGGGGYYHPYGGPAPVAWSSSSPDSILRLTFGTDNRLKAWKKLSR